MPFRERVKRVFGRKDSVSSDGNDLGKSSSRKPSNVYQPGESMPKAKYRQPVDKKHKEQLESFSFAGNIRRKSVQSLYSPMGSRMPSRNSSVDHTWANPGKRYAPGIGTGVLADPMIVGEFSTNAGSTRNYSIEIKASEHHENVSSSTSSDECTRPTMIVGSTGVHLPFSEVDFQQALQRASTRQQVTTIVV